jgi:SAM-dependent methyltransferase
MSEERRAAPGPRTAEASVAPEMGRAAVEDPVAGEDSSAVRPSTRDSSSPVARRRGRMTLRIPDDEVARPETGDPPPVRRVSSAPTPEPAAVALTPMRIISIESEPQSRPNLAPPPPASDPGPVLVAIEEGWAATQDGLDEGQDVEIVSNLQIDNAVSESEPPSQGYLPSEPSAEAATPLASPPLVAHEAAKIELASPDEEEEDVRFDDEVAAPAVEDDVPTPAVPSVAMLATPEVDAPEPPLDGERRSDPGEAPEISAEDMVAVESVPKPRPGPDLPPMRSRLASQPGVDLPPMRPRLSSQPIAPPPARPLVASVAPVAPVPSAKPGPPSTRAPLVIVPPHVGNMGPQAAESLGPRRKGRLWWEDLFNDDYVRTMEKMTDAQIAQEVDFIETSLGLERGGAILDLACGTGRQSIELARRGYEVVGFDLSLQMLARAGDDAQELSAKLNFVQGDMREMAFAEQFDGVYCWNTSFGYFDEEKNANVIDRVHASLKTGGLFLLDVVNRDFIARQSPSLAWFEGDGCVCMDEMTMDFITSRMKVKRTLMLDDGRSREIEYSMRVYSLHELGKVLHEHGFKVCEVTGRIATPGVFFGTESPRTIILAEKR